MIYCVFAEMRKVVSVEEKVSEIELDLKTVGDIIAIIEDKVQ